MVTLRAGFDLRPAAIDPDRGLGRVAAGLARALASMGGLELTVFVPSGVHVEGWYTAGVEVVHLPQPRRGAWLWDGPAWRWVLRRHPVDVLHLPAWGVPPGIPVPVVATLHDVTPVRHPEAIPVGRVRRRAVQRLGTYRRATLVHAVSRATARDAVHVLGIPPERVRVVANGVTPPASPARGPREHVLFVGGADPHKRVDLLVEAWTLNRAPDLPPLVVAGGAAGHPAVRRGAALRPGVVRPLGTVEDGELHALYARAVAVLLPSLWEGFGLPALEGQAHGAVPVLTARSALPEAGGEAALYVPAGAPARRWAEAVLRLVRDPVLAGRLREAGFARARRSTWGGTAARLAGVYREAAMRASS